MSSVPHAIDPDEAVREARRLEALADEIEAVDQQAHSTAASVGFSVRRATDAVEALRDVARDLRRRAERIRQDRAVSATGHALGLGFAAGQIGLAHVAANAQHPRFGLTQWNGQRAVQLGSPGANVGGWGPNSRGLIVGPSHRSPAAGAAPPRRLWTPTGTREVAPGRVPHHALRRSASRWAGRLRVTGTVTAVALGAYDQWQRDAGDPSLSSGERAARSTGVGVSYGAAALAGAAAGSVVPGVGTVAGAAIGAGVAFAAGLGVSRFQEDIADGAGRAYDAAGDLAAGIADEVSDAAESVSSALASAADLWPG